LNNKGVTLFLNFGPFWAVSRGAKMNTRTLTVAALAVAASLSMAQDRFFMASDYMSYDLTMTKYASLSDAQNSVNSLGSYTLSDPATNDRRDLGTYFVQDVATFDTDYAIFTTAWYYTTDPDNGAYSGWGNPNNTNTGFVQMYDDNASTVSSMSATWSTLNAGVADASTFSMSASGTNATHADEFARLWHGATGGTGSLTNGTFLSWDFNMTATGLTADWDGTHNLFVANDHPSTVSGGFNGIFQNDNVTDSQYNGFYVFSGTLNSDSWAYANSGDLNGAFSNSAFGAVPEPATMTVFGLAALAGLRKRKKNS
jgi:hypothetical protein